MKQLVFALLFLVIPLAGFSKTDPPISDETQSCLECHREVTPGIVKSWERSRHSRITVGQAMKLSAEKRRVSAKKVPKRLLNVVVGCAECHTNNPKSHKDTFEHNGFSVHVVVTPKDCATCHPTEVKEFQESLMGHAYGNLMNNPTYRKLIKGINRSTSEEVANDSCLECHGTRVQVAGLHSEETSMGPMEFPVLKGWPNQGVGRINPDGSRGSCTSCHGRHSFSIAQARSPASCGHCHKGPDTPAYKIYMVSKHGVMYKTSSSHWNMDAVPWKAGEDFSAPTCAACHMSEIAGKEGDVVVPRTHNPDKRLWVRLFGLPYSHPQPASSDTSAYFNKDGLNLVTNLDGTVVEGMGIDNKTALKRQGRMKKVCSSCHSRTWIQGHFARMKRVAVWTDNQVLVSTKLMKQAWAKGIADPKNPFDEFIEKLWVRTWLYYANSIRFAAAMAGADYGVFERGREYLAKTIDEIRSLLGSPIKPKSNKKQGHK